MKKIFILLLFLPLAVLCTGMFSFQDAQKGAEQGSMLHQYALAEYYAKGIGGVTQDLAKAAEWYKKSAEQGYALAQYEYAVFLETGWGGVKIDLPKAAEMYRKAADLGVPPAQVRVGVALLYGDLGFTQDRIKAVEYFESAVAQGNAAAKIHLADCYAAGLGVKQDLAKARSIYLHAAQAGDPAAMCALGKFLLQQREQTAALVWIRQAARMGDGQGLYLLGCMEKDARNAAAYFQQAAERGYPYAYYSLGLCYYDGRGVAENRKLALKWIRRAAEAGVPEAQEFLRKIRR